MKSTTLPVWLALALVFVLATPATLQSDETGDAARPHFVATIKPLHSLIKGVVGESAVVELLLDGAASPHAFYLQPSHIKKLHRANVIFYISPEFELFMPRVLASLPKTKHAVVVAETPSMTVLPQRTKHEHHQPQHEHKHEHEGHDEHKEHEKHHGDTHAQHDLHLWLDPQNAIHMTRHIAYRLGELYPSHRALYAANAQRLVARLNDLDKRIADDLKEVRDVPFIVLHDAYQYFEHRYGLGSVGAFMLEPDHPLSPRRITNIREVIKRAGARCFFYEPQFPTKKLAKALTGYEIKSGVLDPLGTELTPGADAYFGLLSQLAANFRSCLL